MVLPAFLIKFGVVVGPLFIVRDFVARYILKKPATWKWFEETTFRMWLPYYGVMTWFYKTLDKIQGKSESKFWTIEDAIPWDRLARILCSIKEDFERNRLLAVLDLIYPISTIANIAGDERAALQLVAPSEEYADVPVIEANHNLWRECRYAVEFATYVYFMDFLGEPKGLEMKLGPFMPKMTSDDTFEPGYFVAFDQANQRLILCIRGSSTMGDFGTDIDALPTEMIHINGKSYSVHRGIWLAARRLDARIKDTVIQLFNDTKFKYPRLELVVCGHSLGAGVTSLLGVIWHYGLTDDISELSSVDPVSGIKDRFYCYSFASPPVIDEKGRDYLLKHMKNPRTDQHVITSVANQIDIVTRMSIPGLFDASNKIQWIGSSLKNYQIIDQIEKKRCESDQNFIQMIMMYILKNSGQASPQTKKKSKSSKKAKAVSPLPDGDPMFTDDEIDFIAKFAKFGNVDELGLPDRVVENQADKDYPVLFPCGLLVWRIPALPWHDLDTAYTQLSDVVNSNNFAIRSITWLGRIYYDVFGDVDIYGNYESDSGDCKRYFSRYEMYQMDGKNPLSNFYIFRNMVINTGAAVCDHMQGQYSSMFGINLISVFKKSSRAFARFIPEKDEFILIKIVKYMIAFVLFLWGWFWGTITGVFR